jgi:hypothetical protein
LVATGPGQPSTAVAPTTTAVAGSSSATPTTAPPASGDAAVAPPPIEVDDPDAGVGAAPDQPPPVLPDPTAGGSGDQAVALPADPGPPDPAPVADPPPGDGVVVAGAPSGPAPPPPPPPPPPTTLPPPPPPPPPPPEVAPATATAVAEPGRVWAVAIGIDDYPGTRHDLLAARRDAVTVVDTLLGFGVPQDHILELLDEEATVAALIGAADWLAAHAGPDDVAIFFYAGHVRKFGPGTELIVAADGGWIADWYLGDALAPLIARDTWIVIAGCYGGGFDELLTPGRILTGAAPPWALAYENDDFNRSYLVEYVFERGLRQGLAGVPTVQGAAQWAIDRMAEEAPAHLLWHTDHSVELISVDGARRGPPPDPVAPPEAPTTTAPPRRPCRIPGLLC